MKKKCDKRENMVGEKTNSYFHYSLYLLKHKTFVSLECIKRGLIWRGIKHDWDKFLPFCFKTYALFFYGKNKPPRDKNGYYKPHNTGNPDFERAWLKHIRRNDHHWQYWVVPHDADVGGNTVHPFNEKAALEMICDWIGAGKAQNSKLNAKQWYGKNKHKLILHEKTKKYIENKLDEMF